MASKVIAFSPTGGTQKVADIISGAWEGASELIDLTEPAFDGNSVSIGSDDLVLIAMPDFGGRAPAVAVERLRSINGNGARCAVAIVYGNRAFEDGLVEMADAARDAGFRVIAGVAAIAEHSIMHQFATGRPDARDAEQLAEFGRAIAQLTDGSIDALPAIPGDRPYKKAGAVPLVPSVNKRCTKCGTCADTCPVSAIERETFKADGDVCISCMRCIKVCPVDARSVNGLMVKMAAKMIGKEASKRKDPELFA